MTENGPTPRKPRSASPRETLRIIRDDPQKAIERLLERIAAGEADYRTWHNLAVSRLKAGELAGAVEAVTTALEASPESAVSHFLHGMLLKAEGRLDASLAAFEIVEGLDPRFPRLHANRGIVHFFLDDADAAWEDLESAIRQDEHDTQSLFNSAVVAVARKEYAEAQGRFERLVAQEPARASHYQRFLVEIGRAQVIEETFSQVHRLKNFMSIVGDRLRRFCEVELDGLDPEPREDLTGIREDYERIYLDLSMFLGAIQPRSLRLESVDLRRLMARIAFVAGSRSEGVRVEQSVPEDLPPVTCDVNQIQEAFLNLLLNALEAVRMADRPEEEGFVSITALQGGSSIQISFEDNGVGIPEGELNRIFQFGFTTKSLGTGIGLAHTRRILEDHGGRIEAKSAEGEGTTLTCHLPVQPLASADLATLSLRSPLLEDPRELILEEEGEDLGI